MSGDEALEELERPKARERQAEAGKEWGRGIASGDISGSYPSDTQASEATLLADLGDAAYMLGRLGGREGIGTHSVAMLRAEIVAASHALAELWAKDEAR